MARRTFEEIYPPPSAPAPPGAYVLRSNGEQSYDIFVSDAEDSPSVGSIYRQQGDEQHYSTWELQLQARHEVFRTLKDARTWLGGAKIKQWP